MEYNKMIRPEGVAFRNEAAETRWQDMVDLAHLLGGQSLKSFERCVEFLSRRDPTKESMSVNKDSTRFCVGWMLHMKNAEGVFKPMLNGAMIFDSSDNTWLIHG